MTVDLKSAYREACQPFAQTGALSPEGDPIRAWRYFLEINSACSLRCISCTKGNKAGYDHQNGIMDPALMEQIIDKIASENPKAIVFLYGNSEPFLHPRLPECISAVKSRGLRCELSTNLNRVQRLEEVLAAGLDMIIVSLSGFTQEVYERGHCGGDIEKVKLNMILLGEANRHAPKPVPISVNYHLYNDNQQEVAPMRKFAEEAGLGFFTSTARIISMENSLQYLRELEEKATGQPVPYVVQEAKPDWNQVLPPSTAHFREVWARLNFTPDQARERYKDLPVHEVCPVGELFTFVRHDGKTSLCPCVADRRISLGNYLETTQEQLSEQRRGHAICQMCMKFRQNAYFMNIGLEPTPS